MAKLNRIQKETLKDVALDFGDGEILNLTIVSSQYTLGWQRKSVEIGKTNDLALIADHFFIVVKDWDLEGEDGKKIPLDPSGYDQLSAETFGAILTKLGEQNSPNDEATSTS